MSERPGGGAAGEAERKLAAARELLRDAAAAAQRAGDSTLAARATDALVAAGGRPRRPQLTGTRALTPSERAVCERAAAGATNKAIAESLVVSVGTVETHLRNAFRKLDITSRAQIPRGLAGAPGGRRARTPEHAVARLAAGMAPAADALGLQFAEMCHREVPQLARTPDGFAATVASGVANFGALFASFSDHDVSRLPAPIVVYPQRLAEFDLGIETVLSAYRVATRGLWTLWCTAAEARIADPVERADVLRVCVQRSFAYVDRVTGTLLGDTGGAVAPEDRVETVKRAVAVLGYDLRRWHLAAVLWGDDAPSRRALAGRLADATGAGRPLLVAVDPDTTWVWLPRRTRFPAGAPEHAGAAGLALGRPGHGPAGFRRSHREALAAQALMRRAGGGGEVAVLSLLTADLPRARAFVRTELGPLALQPELCAAVESRLTRDREAAGALGIDDATLEARLRRAETLLGRPLPARSFELEAALRLRRSLG